jgi:hypothetical protein
MARARGVVLVLWPVALALVLLAPLRHSGHLLARDLVFVPREPLTDAAIGLGGAAPRSVPLDAVVAVLTSVMDGGVLGRLLLVLTLLLAGWGTLRLTAGLGTTARLAALVLGYAVLPWVLVSAAAFRRTGSRRAFAAVVLWSVLGSLTPTGGLFAVGAVISGGASRRRRSWLPVLAVALLQLPWVAPALVGGGSRTSDPAGVAVFAPGSDASGHPALALLGLGGIWDGLSVPDTRQTWLAAAAIVFVAVSAVVGARRWWSSAPDLAPRVAALGLVGLALALALTTGPGQDLLRHAVTSVPGAGLLRDGQKLLAPFVVLVACLFGGAVDVAARALARYGEEVVAIVGVLFVLVPVALVPDGPGAVWRTVQPVPFPDALDRVATTIDAGPPGRALVTLPWRSYRNFAWGTGYPSSDPLVRMVDRPVITSEDLGVGERVVRGESAVAARIGDALRRGSPADVLPAYGVGWVVVYADDPTAPKVDVTGLRRQFQTPELTLYAVPGAVAAPEPATWRRLTVTTADLLALLLVLGSAAAGLLAGRSRAVGDPGEPLLQSAKPSPKEP